MRASLSLLLVCLALYFAPAACESQVRAAETVSRGLAGRSLVLIVADSLAASHLSAYGAPRPTSPYLAELARGGVRVDEVYSQTSWTLSSMVSVFTGVHQEVHGVLRADERLGDDFTTLAELFAASGYRTVGIVQNGVVGPHTGLDRGFDAYDVVDIDEAGTAELVRRAAEATSAAYDEPVFLYVHLEPPHMPYQPPAPFATQFIDPDYGGEMTGSIMDCAYATRDAYPSDGADVQHLRDLYDGHLAYADSILERLVEPLVAADRGAEFAFLFTADHGEAFNDHGVVGHGPFVYEKMVRIPLVLSAPNSALPRGAVLPGPASLLDVLPSLCELFDLRLPAHALAGQSIAAWIDAGTSDPERELFLSSRYPKEGERVQRAIKRGRWKLVQPKDDGAFLLFDLSEDPGELVDLADRETELAEELARELTLTRSALSAAGGRTERVELDAATRARMDALGYGGDDHDSVTGNR